jgi:hypothetical protein
MKKALILFFPLIAIGAQAQVIPVGFIKKKNTILPTLGSTSTYFSLGLVDATISGNITSAGGSSITVSGICYSATNTIPTITDNVTTNGSTSIGLFKSLISGLTSNTTYYARAYATNSDGTSYGNTVIFSTYGTVVTKTGKTWLDRNLGASRIAQSTTDASSYGDYFEWGRPADGHEKMQISGTSSDFTSVRSSTSVPSDSKYIKSTDGSNDWLATPDNTLWTGANPTNNPCPAGFRLPTEGEFLAEAAKFTAQNASGSFESIYGLRLPLSGVSKSSINSPNQWQIAPGNFGQYLTQTAYTIFSGKPNGAVLYFGVTSSSVWTDRNYTKIHGQSVRCIQN